MNVPAERYAPSSRFSQLHALDLGYFDDETCRLEPIGESLRSESVTYVSGIICYLCPRNGPAKSGVPNARQLEPDRQLAQAD